MNTDANKEQRALEHIQSVVDKLLDPEGGCPWDRAQTPVSLCEYIIEECHELVDAIRSGKPGHACDEMGDLLFLLIITARRFADAGSFSLADALNAGEIKAAGLDVLSVEPMAEDSPLLNVKDKDRLFITPHIAWATIEARQRLMKIIAGQIEEFLAAAQ